MKNPIKTGDVIKVRDKSGLHAYPVVSTKWVKRIVREGGKEVEIDEQESITVNACYGRNNCLPLALKIHDEGSTWTR